jgi:predicted house-cleaning noncanonical NTP pyrophosphatase (MazG superfamily)
MRTFKLNKLVRDKIVDEMKAKRQEPEVRKLQGAELIEALIAKLLEEARELDSTKPESTLRELVDLQEVIDELTVVLGSSSENLRRLQDERRNSAGSLAGHYFVGELALRNDDPWVEYYAAEPDRFPEITKNSDNQVFDE